MKENIDFTTKSGVRIIAAILGDGCLDKHFRIFYSNSNPNLIAGFINDAKNVFGSDLKYWVVKKTDNPNVKIVGLSSKYGKIVVDKIRMKTGRKVLNNPDIPKFIFNLSKEKIVEFLSQIIDDEGSISIASRHIRIKFALAETEKQSHLVDGLQKLFHELGIETSIYQIGRYNSSTGIKRKNWQIEIHSFEQLEKLTQILNLRHKEKLRKLQNLVNNKKQVQYQKRKINEIYLSAMRTIQNTKGYFTTKDLLKEIKRSGGHIRNMVHKYNSKNMIQKIQDVKSIGIGCYPAKYRVVQC